MIIRAALVMLLAVPASSSPLAAAAKSGFQLDGEKWTYATPERTFAGYLLKPEGKGPFPAVIINHGKGGRPEQFSLGFAREMVTWGLVCICPTLTHVAGTDIQGKDGASDENIARNNDCLAILAQLGCVDLKRVAVCGHSMGGFLTIGFSGTVGSKIKAAAIIAGGIAPKAGFAAPPPELAQKITAPFMMLHGTVDRAVAPAMSAALKEILDANKVPNRRVIFQGTDHDLPQNPATRETALALLREWFTSNGVLLGGNNTAPTLTPPPDQTIAAGVAPAPIKFTVTDRETQSNALVVKVASSNPKVLLASDIVLAGSGGERTLIAKPQADQFGPTTVFLTVSDGQLVTTRWFVLGFANRDGVVPQPVIQRGPPFGKGPSRGRGSAAAPGAPGARGP